MQRITIKQVEKILNNNPRYITNEVTSSQRKSMHYLPNIDKYEVVFQPKRSYVTGQKKNQYQSLADAVKAYNEIELEETL